MIGLIIASIILIVIMLAFVFILFKNIVKRIDDNAKTYFVNKMQNYDYILEEKQETLKELNEKIDEIKAENKNILKDYNNEDSEQETDDENDSIDEEIKVAEKPTSKVKYDLNIPEYRDASNFFNSYKKIKKIFSINNEKIINTFVKKNKKASGEKEYIELKKIRDKFDNDAIYSFMTLSKENQINILQKTLTAQERKLINFDDMIQNTKFNINELISYIEIKMQEVDPTIYVYINSMTTNYDYMDKHIVTKQYSNMSEGIIIEYRNKIYDYSI